MGAIFKYCEEWIFEKISFFLRLILHGIDTAQKIHNIFSSLKPHFPSSQLSGKNDGEFRKLRSRRNNFSNLR